jgi:hypothetical protein
MGNPLAGVAPEDYVIDCPRHVYTRFPWHNKILPRIFKSSRSDRPQSFSYEPPQTPCQRLLASGHIKLDAKTNLQEVYNSLNPFTLKRKIEEKLRQRFISFGYLLL